QRGAEKDSSRQSRAPLLSCAYHPRAILDHIAGEQTSIANVGNLVFLRDARPVTGNRITKERPTAVERAGFTKSFACPDSRRTAPTEWAKRGIAPAIAMKAAGHNSVEMYKSYIKLQQGDVAKAFGTAPVAVQLRSGSKRRSRLR